MSALVLDQICEICFVSEQEYLAMDPNGSKSFSGDEAKHSLESFMC